MRLRLSSKLIISVVLIEVVMLSVLVWNSVRLIGSSHAQALENNISEQSTLLSTLLAPGLATDDRAMLLDALSLLRRQKHIVYADVRDRNGVTMAQLGTIPTQAAIDRTFEDAKRDGVFDVNTPIALFNQPLGSVRVGYSVDGVLALVRQTRWQNTLIAGLEILLSITATLLLGLVLTRSLRKLEHGAQALTRDELEHRIELDSQDEMGDLARAFNRLASHLSETRSVLADEHAALERQSRQLTALLNSVDAVVVESDGDWDTLRYVSAEAERLLGYPVRDWLTPGFLDRSIHPEDRKQVRQSIEAHANQPGSFRLDFRMTHRDGKVVWIRTLASVETRGDGGTICRGLLLDITEQKAADEHIIYLADHDALTGLFNRRRFRDELDRALAFSERFDQPGALMFLDLDQFKYINDTLGHQAGDEYLQHIAQRLSRGVRKVDILGRIGGDEFGIILPRTDRARAEQAAAKALKALSGSTVLLGGQPAPISASIGIVIFPQADASPDKLLAMADAAMYRVKDTGRNGYHVYQDDDHTLLDMQSKLDWEQRIRHALIHDRFTLYFQPVFNLNGRSVSHYEVLLRLQEDDGSLTAPGAFLGIAERFGMIRDIDHWVLEHAIAAQAASLDTAQPLTLAINISGRHFGNPEVLDWIHDAIRDSGADPASLIFEVTETAAVENIHEATAFVDALHKLGCRIALDDFGVGFSSFHYLKHLPVDMIKLDGSFIRNLTGDGFDRVFVRAMSEMAAGLGIISVAEFVETEDVVDVLVELGVLMAQGYHLARPAPDCPYPCVVAPHPTAVPIGAQPR